MKRIPLTKGQTTVVDDAWYDMLSTVKWQAIKASNGKFYAIRGFQTSPGRTSGELMARVILDAPSGLCVDHIDGNPLNNQTSNLRLCNLQQNAHNRERCRTRSLPKGVYPSRSGKYYASILVDGKANHLGTHPEVRAAAEAYNRAALTHFGEFARINNLEEL